MNRLRILLLVIILGCLAADNGVTLPSIDIPGISSIFGQQAITKALYVYESSDRPKMKADQIAVLTSVKLRSAAKSAGVEMLVADQNDDLSAMGESWVTLRKQVTTVPAVAYQRGSRIVIKPFPVNEAEAINQINGGK